LSFYTLNSHRCHHYSLLPQSHKHTRSTSPQYNHSQSLGPLRNIIPPTFSLGSTPCTQPARFSDVGQKTLSVPSTRQNIHTYQITSTPLTQTHPTKTQAIGPPINFQSSPLTPYTTSFPPSLRLDPPTYPFRRNISPQPGENDSASWSVLGIVKIRTGCAVAAATPVLVPVPSIYFLLACS